MQLEKRRHVQIALHFMHNDRTITSEELALLTKVSTRTIKSDIAIINDVLKLHGAEIHSKKSEGYYLTIHDVEKFAKYKKEIEIINLYYVGYGGEQHLTFVLRTVEILHVLFTAEDYVNIDDLAEHMYMSRSTIKQDLQQVRNYLESYHLRLESKPTYGLKVVGEERHFRMAMINTFGINSPAIENNIKNERYRKQLTSSDYDLIRKDLLEVLRKYRYCVKDNASQTLSRYLMVMRSRIALGYPLVLEKKYKSQLKEFEVQQAMVSELFEVLKKYQGFDVSEDERDYVVMYLVAYHDYEGAEITENTMRFLFKPIQKMYYEADEFIKTTLGLEDNFVRTREQLLYNVSRIVVRKYFDFLPYNQLNYGRGYEAVRDNPVAINLASYLATYFEERLFCKLNTKDMLYLAHYFDELLEQIEFQYVPMRLVTISGFGRNYSLNLIEHIRHRYGKYIKSNVSKELYELRGVPKEEVDLVILDGTQFAYRYDYPYAKASHRNFNEVEESLKHSFILDEECEKLASMMKVYQNYEFKNREDCFRILSYKYGVDELSVKEMIEIFNRHEERISYGRYGIVLLMADYRFVQRDCFEIYRLKSQMDWGENQDVKCVIFVSADFFSNIKLMKSLACLMTTLYTEEMLMEELFTSDDRLSLIKRAIIKTIDLNN